MQSHCLPIGQWFNALQLQIERLAISRQQNVGPQEAQNGLLLRLKRNRVEQRLGRRHIQLAREICDVRDEIAFQVALALAKTKIEIAERDRMSVYGRDQPHQNHQYRSRAE